MTSAAPGGTGAPGPKKRFGGRCDSLKSCHGEEELDSSGKALEVRSETAAEVREKYVSVVYKEDFSRSCKWLRTLYIPVPGNNPTKFCVMSRKLQCSVAVY